METPTHRLNIQQKIVTVMNNKARFLIVHGHMRKSRNIPELFPSPSFILTALLAKNEHPIYATNSKRQTKITSVIAEYSCTFEHLRHNI